MSDSPANAGRPGPAGAAARGAGLSLALLLTINLFNYIDRYILVAVEPRIGEAFLKDDPNQKFKLGLLATAFLVSYMLLAPVFGWLGDRTRRWVIVGVGVILWSLASGGSGLATGFAILLATRVFVGIGEAAHGPVAPTIIADLYPIEHRGRVLAWFYLAIPVGSALGYAFGGAVLKVLDWPWAFYLVVPPGLVLGLLCFLRREPARGQSDAAVCHRSARLGDYRALLRTPSYVLNTLGMTAMTFAVGGVSFWMPRYVSEFRAGELVASPDENLLPWVNMVFGGITVGAGLTGTLIGGMVGDAMRRRFPGAYFLVSGAAMIAAFPTFLMVLYVPFPWSWGSVFMTVFLLFFSTGPTNTILANVTHPSIRASAYAINIFIIHALGDAISPPIIGAITDWTRSPAHPNGNMSAAFLTVSGATLLGGVFWLWGARHLRRDTERAATSLDAPTGGGRGAAGP